MRYAAPLAIIATSMAGALTIVAVHAVGVGAEAHPITRLAASHVGWVGYLVLSVTTIAIGLRLLARFPFAEWGIRVVALVKVADAVRDAWLVTNHPAVGSDAVWEVLPALLVIAVTAVVALLVVSGPPSPRLQLDPELAI